MIVKNFHRFPFFNKYLCNLKIRNLAANLYQSCNFGAVEMLVKNSSHFSILDSFFLSVIISCWCPQRKES